MGKGKTDVIKFLYCGHDQICETVRYGTDSFERLVANAEIAQLFYNTVHRVNAKDDTKE